MDNNTRLVWLNAARAAEARRRLAFINDVSVLMTNDAKGKHAYLDSLIKEAHPGDPVTQVILLDKRTAG